jgi:hypothetical protein
MHERSGHRILPALGEEPESMLESPDHFLDVWKDLAPRPARVLDRRLRRRCEPLPLGAPGRDERTGAGASISVVRAWLARVSVETDFDDPAGTR